MMSRVDKNKAIIDYLLTCSDIADSSVYFNLINAKNNAIQIIVTAEDKALSKPFIDGSVKKKYTLNLVTFKSISELELTRPSGGVDFPNENVDELEDVQKLIDWIEEQEKLRNYPDFGEGYVIEKIDTTTDIPKFEGINAELSPPLAMYSMTVEIEYIDETKVIYNK